MKNIPSRAYFQALFFAVVVGTFAFGISLFQSSREARSVYLTVEAIASEAGISQMFFNTGSGYSEEASEKVSFKSSEESQLFRFKMPESEVLSIRFDPSNGAKPVVLKALSFQSSNRKVLKDVSLDTVTAVVPDTQSEQTDSGLKVYPSDASKVVDPQTQLNLEFPILISYGLGVFVTDALGLGLVAAVLCFLFWFLVRVLSQTSMLQFLRNLPKTIKNNLYLVNKPE